MGAACPRKCCQSLVGLFRPEPPNITASSSLVAELANHNRAKSGRLQRPDFLPPPLPTDSGGMEQFYSFDESMLASMSFGTQVRRSKLPGLSPSEKIRKKIKSTNNNHISQYGWLQELMQLIISGGAKEAAKVVDSQKTATPLFVVAGACPNSVCGMQAVMYSLVAPAVVEFWWVKPQASNPSAFERNTMDMHNQGQFKNAAGKAKAVYEPLATKFNGEVDGDFAFGVDDETGRAFIDEVDENGSRTRMLLFFVWQETWSSMMARRKFMKGKLFYQKGGDACDSGAYFARQYNISDGKLFILEAATEEEVPTLLPPDSLQDLFEMHD